MRVQQLGERRGAGHDADFPAGALLERALVAVAAAVGPLLAGVGLGALDVQLAPSLLGKRQVVLGEADCFLGPEGGVVQAAEERDQAPAAALLADGVKQRAGLDRVGDPPPVDPVGGLGVHFSAGIGFLSSSSSSTAYSRAAWRILRRRLVTLGAAGVPSSLTVRPSRTCRNSLGSRSADTGRVWLVAQRRALRTSSGQLGSSRRAVLNASASARRGEACRRAGLGCW